MKKQEDIPRCPAVVFDEAYFQKLIGGSKMHKRTPAQDIIYKQNEGIPSALDLVRIRIGKQTKMPMTRLEKDVYVTMPEAEYQTLLAKQIKNDKRAKENGFIPW